MKRNEEKEKIKLTKNILLVCLEPFSFFQYQLIEILNHPSENEENLR